MNKLTVISLGWGVQSWTLAAMSALEELPPVDFAIHSDTTWERQSTYEFAAQWTPWLAERGVNVVTVNDQDVAGAVVDQWGGTFIPAYTLTPASIHDGHTWEVNEETDETEWVFDPDLVGTTVTGKNGQLRRQCTNRWKITPMRRQIAAELDRRGLSKTPGIVQQWLGITLDEWRRAKDSDVQYIKHVFPLLDRKMTRGDCIAWLAKNGLPAPDKSACTFCPYHNRLAWEQMKREGGADWQQAVEVDAAIRDKRPPFPLFVHPTRVPLEDAVRIPEDYGAEQLEMFSGDDDDECDSGYCFM